MYGAHWFATIAAVILHIKGPADHVKVYTNAFRQHQTITKQGPYPQNNNIALRKAYKHHNYMCKTFDQIARLIK